MDGWLWKMRIFLVQLFGPAQYLRNLDAWYTYWQTKQVLLTCLCLSVDHIASKLFCLHIMYVLIEYWIYRSLYSTFENFVWLNLHSLSSQLVRCNFAIALHDLFLHFEFYRISHIFFSDYYLCSDLRAKLICLLYDPWVVRSCVIQCFNNSILLYRLLYLFIPFCSFIFILSLFLFFLLKNS